MTVLIDYPRSQLARITLNRPNKRNALDLQLMQELLEALRVVERNEEVRVLILTGAGPHFCAGLDLSLAKSQDGIEESAKLLKSILLTLYHASMVTICSVKGGALAGGLGIMAVCDIILSERGALFALPEVRRGLVPAIILAFLRRYITDRGLKRLALTGSAVEADEAKEIGLISEVVEGDPDMKALEVAADVIKGAPGALFHTKQLMEQLEPTSILEELKIAEHPHRLSRESNEAREGIEAFFQKRPASWEIS